MNTLETLRLSRFDVVSLYKNHDNETIQCHFITSALNPLDAAFIFGQNNPDKDYIILRVDAFN